jgi:hypothetical protein
VAYWAEAYHACPIWQSLASTCRRSVASARPVHPHGSDYKPPHRELEEAARGVVLTGEALGAVATDGVDGGNGSQVSEGTNSLAPCNTHFLQE